MYYFLILYVNVICHVFVQVSKMSKPKDIIDQEPDIPFYDVHEVVVPHLGHIPIAKGDFHRLPKKAQKFIAYYVSSDSVSYTHLTLPTNREV